MITFLLLTGNMPFEDEDDIPNMFDLIVKCNYEFKPELWGNISTEAKDFVT